MSADNGIYILKLKDQYRVIHAQAIDNLWWSHVSMTLENDFVPTRIVEYYGGAKPLSTEQEATSLALKIYDEIMEDDFCPIIEYGISKFEIDKTWNEIVEDAKEFALEEIKSVCNEEKTRHDGCFVFAIESLLNIYRDKEDE